MHFPGRSSTRHQGTNVHPQFMHRGWMISTTKVGPNHISSAANGNEVSTAIVPAVLGREQVESFLANTGIEFGFRYTEEVQRATQGKRDVKTLVLMLNDSTPVLCILPVARKVSYAKLAALLQVSKKSLQMAPPDEAIRLTGYRIGTIPPLAHNNPAELIIVDTTLVELQDETVFVGSGEVGVDLEISAADLLAVLRGRGANCRIGDISETPSKQPSPSSSSSSSSASSFLAARGPRPSPSATHEGSRATAVFAEPVPPEQLGTFLEREDGLVELEAVVGPRRRMSKLLMFATLAPSFALLGRTLEGDRLLWRRPHSYEPLEIQLIVGKTVERNLGREGAGELLAKLKVGTPVRVLGRMQAHIDRDGIERTDRAEIVTIECVPNPPIAPVKGSLPGVLVTAVEQTARREVSAAAAAAAAATAAATAAAGSLSRKKEEDEALDVAPPTSGAPLQGPRGAAVLLVDTMEGLRELERYLEVEPSLPLGLDAEWRPFSSGNDRRTPVSILQMASASRCFILDMLALVSSPYARVNRPFTARGLSETEELVNRVLSNLFASSRPKIGFGFGTDLQRLQQSFPHLPVFGGSGRLLDPTDSDRTLVYVPYEDPVASPLVHYIDVMSIVRASDPTMTNIVRLSLRKIVELYLGAPLSKEQQLSDWQLRPLSPAQIQYAADDAYVLVKLFDRALEMEPSLAEATRWKQLSGVLEDAAQSYTKRHKSALEIWIDDVTSTLEAAERSGDDIQIPIERADGDAAPTLAARPSPTISFKELVKQVVANNSPSSSSARGHGLAAGPISSGGKERQLEQLLRKPPLTSAVDCNLAAFEPYLGRELPAEGGRESVMDLAMKGNANSSLWPRSPRGSGLMTWRNALFLFISLGSRYENEFLDGGRKFTWFAGKGGDSLNSTRIVEKAGDPATPAVLLFVRRSKAPYTYLGRVVNREGAAHTASDGRKFFVLELEDFDKLKLGL